MSEPIDNGMRGTKAEKLFDIYCLSVGLNSNPPSSLDRGGWDRIVEFTHPPLPKYTSLDKRPAPISAHVQIKSVKPGKRSCRLRLSSAELLAKNPKPAFIYVLEDDNTCAATTAHIIHLSGAALERILKRLRSEQQKNGATAKINKAWITIPLALGVRLDANGPALKQAIETAVGGLDKLQDYIERKRGELERLGFAREAFVGHVTFSGVTMDELVDGFLGLRDLPFKEMTATEVRFGIPLQLMEMSGQGGKLSIAPSKPSLCRLICRRPGEPPAVVEGELRKPGIPGLSLEDVRLLFRHPLFDLEIPLSDKRRWNLKTTHPVWVEGRFTAKVWTQVHRLLAYLPEPGSVLTIDAEGFPAIEFVSNASHRKNLPTNVRALVQLCEQAQKLLETAGSENELLSWDDLATSHADVMQCLALMDGTVKDGFASFALDCDERLPSEPVPMNFFSIFPIGALHVAYSVLATMAPVGDAEPRKWQLCFETFGDIKTIRDVEREYPAFQERVGKRTGVSNNVSWGSSRLVDPGDVAGSVGINPALTARACLSEDSAGQDGG